MNDIKTNTRPSFFPDTKSNIRTGRGGAIAKAPYINRNSTERKDQLEQLAKRDVKVAIPQAVKDFSRIRKAVDKAPEIDNSSKVAALKQQIKNGDYKMDYDELANKMLASGF